MTFSPRTRLVMLALSAGLDALSAFDMPALEFAARVRAARMGRGS